MPELDPATMAKIYDSVLSQLPQVKPDPGAALDQLSKDGLLTDKEKQTLHTILTKGHSNPKPSSAEVVKEIDAVLGGSREDAVATVILKTIRFLDNAQASAGHPGQQDLLSIPNVPWDPAAGSDGCVAGGVGGAIVGGAVGGVPGALFGAAIGGIIGGLIEGVGHGAKQGGGAK